MIWQRRARLALVTLALATIAAYIWAWLSVSPKEIGRSDFTSTYMGAMLWRQGHHADLYNEQLQSRLHHSLIAPDSEGNLPFVNPPAAAVLLTPLTFLNLDTAYRIWQALQLALLFAAAVIAWRGSGGRRFDFGAVIIAFAGIGTLSLGLLGQWDGLVALALAAGIRLWQKSRWFAAGLVIALGFALAKPHLALGIAAFLLGVAYRRLLLGAAAGVAAVGLGSLLAVGPGGMAGFIQADRVDAFRFNLSTFLGFTGAFGAWISDRNLVQIDAAVLSIATMALCYVIGRRWRQGFLSGLQAWSAVTPLSLLASPHLLAHDLAVLVPSVTSRLRLGAASGYGIIALAWLLLNGVALWGLGAAAGPPLGRIEPWALLLLTAVCLRRTPKSPA